MATKKKTPKKKIAKKAVETGSLFDTDKSTQEPKKNLKQKIKQPLRQKEIISEPVVVYEKPTTTQKKETIGFDYSLPIYLQLHKGNIFSIFSSGIIAPAKHIKNRAFQDIQSINDNILVISNGYNRHLDSHQVLIEIVLTGAEKKQLQVEGSIAILTIPIPISRIQSVYVADAQTKKDILTKALSGDGGIIPESLVIAEFPQGLWQSEIEIAIAVSESDHSDKLQRFDKILGSFAFIKNYSLALANQTESLSILPKHFFYMAQAINKLKDFSEVNGNKEILFYEGLFGVKQQTERKELQWLFERLNESGNFSNKDVEVMGDIILSNKYANEFTTKVRKHLKDLTDNLKRKQTLNEILLLPEQEKFYLYLLGVLRIYGNLNTEDKSISRRELPDFIKPSIGEYIYASLGYFYGYSALRNFDDAYNFKDKKLAALIPDSKNLHIKFELTNLLDYVIIESVYQVVFHDNALLSDISYLRSGSIKRDTPKIFDIQNKEYRFDYRNVFGKNIYTISKKSMLDDAIKAASQLNDATPVISEIGLLCWRSGVSKSYIGIQELFSGLHKIQFFVHFKKDAIIDAIKSRKLNASEFLQRLELSDKFKEL